MPPLDILAKQGARLPTTCHSNIGANTYNYRVVNLIKEGKMTPTGQRKRFTQLKRH